MTDDDDSESEFDDYADGVDEELIENIQLEKDAFDTQEMDMERTFFTSNLEVQDMDMNTTQKMTQCSVQELRTTLQPCVNK